MAGSLAEHHVRLTAEPQFVALQPGRGHFAEQLFGCLANRSTIALGFTRSEAVCAFQQSLQFCNGILIPPLPNRLAGQCQALHRIVCGLGQDVIGDKLVRLADGPTEHRSTELDELALDRVGGKRPAAQPCGPTRRGAGDHPPNSQSMLFHRCNPCWRQTVSFLFPANSRNRRPRPGSPLMARG